MRKAVIIVVILLITPFPLVEAEGDTIHLWSNQAPGPVLLWDESGNLTSVDPNTPINLHLPDGNWTLVRLIDGVPQNNSLIFNADFNATSFLDVGNESPLEITGSSHLNISGPISQSTQTNATWTSSISVPNTLGHPDLEKPHLGIHRQITNQFSDDADLFLQWVTNNTDVDCCAYDKVDMAGDADVVAYIDNQTWGWTAQANLSGQSDGRATRLIWVPITGSFSDQTDLRITLPAPYEIRYSPQSEHISGLPDDFIIDRGAIGVSGNVTIALGTNSAPIASFHGENRDLPWLPFSQYSVIKSDCTDTSIVEPQSRFILHDSISTNEQIGNTLIDSQSNNITIDPMFLGLEPSTWLNLTLECTDSQGLISNHSMDVYIDGVVPTRNLQMEYTHPEIEGVVAIEHGNSSITIPSGSVISAFVEAGDDSAPPVEIKWFSNKTTGWTHNGIGNHAWNDIFLQGSHVNGQHLTIDDRHQEKSLTQYELQMELVDAAGNKVTQHWDITVQDHNAPSPRPAIFVDGNYYGNINRPVEGLSSIEVRLTESWDDIDNITELEWEAWLDDIKLDIGSEWGEIENFVLPPLDFGTHTLIVNATDTSGNTGTHSMSIEVDPSFGAKYRVIEVIKVGEGGPGENGALDVTLENYGQGVSRFKICYVDACTNELTAVEASVDGPGTMTHRLVVDEWSSGPVMVEIILENNTTIEFDSGFSIQPTMTPLMWIFIIAPPIIGLIVLKNSKKEEGNEGS